MSSTQICFELITPDEINTIKDPAIVNAAILRRQAEIQRSYDNAVELARQWLVTTVASGKLDLSPNALAQWAEARSDVAIPETRSVTATESSTNAPTTVGLQGADFGVRPGTLSAEEPGVAAGEPEPEGLGPLVEARPTVEAPLPEPAVGGGIRWHEANPSDASITAAGGSPGTQWRPVGTWTTEEIQDSLGGLAEAGFPMADEEFWLTFDDPLGDPSEPLSWPADYSAQTVRDHLGELEGKLMRGQLTKTEADSLPELIASLAKKFHETIELKEQGGARFAGFLTDEDPEYIFTDMKIVRKVAEFSKRQVILRYRDSSEGLMQEMNICPPAEIECAPARPGAMAPAG